MSNRIANHRQRIQKCVDNLIATDIMYISDKVPAKRNRVLIPLYGYTDFADILNSVLKYPDTQDSEKQPLEDRILNLVQHHFSRYNSYMTDFINKIYSKARQTGFSRTLVYFLYRILSDDKYKIYGLIDAFNLMLFLHLERAPLREKFTEIWLESIDELPNSIKRIILHHDKLAIEENIVNSQPPKEWEEMWVEYISDPEKLILY